MSTTRSVAAAGARRGLAAGACLVLLLAVWAAVVAGPGTALAAAPTKAGARAFAAAVNLVAADLPGYTGRVVPTSAASKSLDVATSRCAGGVDPRRALVNVDSLDFTRPTPGGAGTEEVSSNVGVLPSSALAAKDLAAVRSARGRRCLAAGVNQLLRTMSAKGVTFGRAAISSLSHPAPGTDGSFGLRIKVTATVRSVKIPFWVDEFGFRLGPAEVSLTAVGVLHPYPAADEQRLLALLVARASAHRL